MMLHCTRGFLAIALALACSCTAERASAPRPEQRVDSPPRSTNSRERSRQAKAIANGHKALSKIPQGKARAELMERLAELHLKEADHAAKAGLSAKQHRREALRMLMALIKEQEKGPRHDVHLFLAASVLTDLDRRDHARKLYVKLIKLFPESRHIPDAYLALADWYFNEAQLEKSKRLYQKVLAFEDAPVALYARYKLAWCHYNLEEYVKALDGFTSVVRAPEAEVSHRAIQQEALKDIVLVYAHAGSPEQAVNFFQELSPDMSEALLEKLAAVWADQGRYPDQLALDRQVLNGLGCQARALAIGLRIFRAELGAKRHSQAVIEAERLADTAVRLMGCVPKGEERRRFDEHRTETIAVLKKVVATWQREADSSTSRRLLTPLVFRLQTAIDRLIALG